MNFLNAKEKFDELYKNSQFLQSFLPIHTNVIPKDVKIRNDKGEKLEEYYKWQFFYSIINSGLIAKDYIGVEVYFPKGNANSKPLKLDGAIFDDKDWFQHYLEYYTNKSTDELDWLRKHLIGVVEFKRENSKNIEVTYNHQLKPGMKESDNNYCIGFIYDKERLYIFQKKNEKIIRYNEAYNIKGEDSSTKDLSLNLMDPYICIPSFNEIINKINKPHSLSKSSRTIDNLDKISGINSKQLNEAMSNILRTMDSVSMINQQGYEILIQILALKIFDEKNNSNNLKFYIEQNEENFSSLNDPNIGQFINRIQNLFNEAKISYRSILKESKINFKNISHVKILVETVKQFQDYSFVKSQNTDLYQLVFYRFANEFAKKYNGQFVTPLPIINFLVEIINPKNNERIIDPTVGTADFLSVAFVKSKGSIDDNNIYGIDNDPQMVMLSQLNMLLNGDGNAKIYHVPDKGSITHKISINGSPVKLIPEKHKNGNWDNWDDDTELLKFDVVLTNPPFGENRKWQPKGNEIKIAEMYELWNIAKIGDWIDLGVIFLENAYRILKENGRMGIVISNSIASIERWQPVRNWLLERMRIVALFDLPANVFADTGVNTTLIVAYKPSNDELEKLKQNNYEVFVKDIKNIGYEVKTKKRIKYFEPVYKIDCNTLEIMQDKEGNPVINEDFTEIIKDFKQWALTQEETLQKLFL